MKDSDIIKAIATKNPSYKKGTSITPVGILVHSTGANNKYLKRYVDAPEEVGENKNNNTWNTETSTNSVHAVIGLDINENVRVAQILPYNIACWGCGKGTLGSYNYNPYAHIQFEMCEDDLTDENYFKKVWSVAVEYCQYLCDLFGFDPLEDITSHYEAHAQGYASNHADPRNWFSKFGVTMDDFREAVSKGITSTDTQEVTDSKKLYKVQLGAFKNKDNANKLLQQLQEAGFDGFIKVE